MKLWSLILLISTNIWASSGGDASTPFALSTTPQGEDPQFTFCNPNITQNVSNWAQEMLNVTSANICTSGNFEQGNCKIAGVKVDPSCRSSLSLIYEALTNIRGQAGVGCLNRVNATLAESMISSMNSGNFRVCCNQCENDTIGTTSARGTCAITFPDTISLNITSLSANDPESHCSGRYGSKGLEATLFHEISHMAGVYGYRAHPGTMFNHPITEVSMDERDVISDPVYGCQNYCYGVEPFSNSVSCLTCSLAETVVDGSAGETASWNYLDQRLKNAISSINSDAPPICREIFNSSEHETGRVISESTNLMESIYQATNDLETCSKFLKRDFTSKYILQPVLDKCSEQFDRLHNVCNRFIATLKNGTSTCQNYTGIHTERILQKCDQGRKIVQNSMITSILRFAKDKSSIDCDRWFPAQSTCTTSMRTPKLKEQCLAQQSQ